MGSSELLVGVARADITPPLGIRLAGYTVQQDFANEVHSPITATALLLSGGSAASTTIIIACDLAFIQNPHSDEIRAQIGARLSIDPNHVLINCSHTHLGPMLGWYKDGVDSANYPPSGTYTPAPSDEWRVRNTGIYHAFSCQCNLQDRYLDTLRDTLTGLAGAAVKELQPARLGSATGSSQLGVNRRLRQADGRTVIGINPVGVIDRAVDVIRVDNLQGTTLATIVSTAAHPIVLGPATSALSSDYVGVGRDIIERQTKAPCLFLQGAAGNLMPNCGVGQGGPEQFEDLDRIGSMLGGAALQLWASIRTHNALSEPQFVQSVAAIMTYSYTANEAGGLDSESSLAVATTRLTMPLAPYPSIATAQARLRDFKRERDAALARAAPSGVVNVAERMCAWPPSPPPLPPPPPPPPSPPLPPRVSVSHCATVVYYPWRCLSVGPECMPCSRSVAHTCTLHTNRYVGEDSRGRRCQWNACAGAGDGSLGAPAERHCDRRRLGGATHGALSGDEITRVGDPGRCRSSAHSVPRVCSAPDATLLTLTYSCRVRVPLLLSTTITAIHLQ